MIGDNIKAVERMAPHQRRQRPWWILGLVILFLIYAIVDGITWWGEREDLVVMIIERSCGI